MERIRHEVFPLRTSEDVVTARQHVRSWAVALGFSVVAQTKLITAASELARNTVIYGGGGELRMEEIREGGRAALRLIFEDKGPGIADITLAMTDGYTTGGGLGLGLSGARRLVNEFNISSEPGKGTRVSITQWK